MGSPYPAPVTRRATRDRHGRGPRFSLVPRTAQVGGRRVLVPAAKTPGGRFDDLVLDAVEHLEQRWGAELEQVEFAVEDVPPVRDGPGTELDPEVVADDTAGGAVPLGRVLPGRVDAGGGHGPPRVVVYRRPLEARAGSRAELGELVLDVVVDLVARVLGKDPDEVDPTPE